jgi:hypothetical protein
MKPRSTGIALAFVGQMPIRPLATKFNLPGLLLMVVVGAHPATAQTVPASAAAVPLPLSSPRVVVHVYVEPSWNRMAEWRARVDALKDQAAARDLPISDEVTNGFLAAGGTLLVRLSPRILVGGELGVVQDQDRFAVSQSVSGLFGGLYAYGIESKAIGRNAQFVVALYPSEESRTHVQVGVGMGKAHVLFSSRDATADGEGTGPILSASVGADWKMFYLSAGARFHRMGIKYTGLDDRRVPGGVFVQNPNVDLSGVFVRAGVAFHWFRD